MKVVVLAGGTSINTNSKLNSSCHFSLNKKRVKTLKQIITKETTNFYLEDKKIFLFTGLSISHLYNQVKGINPKIWKFFSCYTKSFLNICIYCIRRQEKDIYAGSLYCMVWWRWKSVWVYDDKRKRIRRIFRKYHWSGLF